MPQISVIVPVYKVEAYLQECVDSILAQTFTDFELILVDDGSPDNCGAICDEYAAKDNRIRVIHQENQGLSGARNSGIDIARGEYITFIDSDDLVTEDYLEVLHYGIETEEADIALFELCEFEDSKVPALIKSKDNIISVKRECLDNRTMCVRLYRGNDQLPINACAKLYRSSVVANLRFPIGRMHEDQAFVPIVCYQAQKVVFINAQKYYYRVRSESITKSKFHVQRYDDVWAIDSCIRFFEMNCEEDIASAAKEKKKRLISVYSIYAKRDGVVIPNEYLISTLRALRYLYHNTSNEKYTYYLSQVNPRYVRWHEYFRKIKLFFKGTMYH